jgi:tetratricopeptide (TPR) repeat protein
MESWRMRQVVLILMCAGILPAALYGKTRRLQVGEPMPAFKIMDDQGQAVAHVSGQDRVVMVVFLSSRQARSDKATDDLLKILHEIGRPAKRLDVFAVVDDPNHFGAWHEHSTGFAGQLHVATDPGKHLWGQFGVIAIPTVIVAGRDDRVVGVAAGYGFDFSPAVRGYLYQALGLDLVEKPATGVAVLANNTDQARVRRLLQTAALLKKQNHLESALLEVRRAHELQPESHAIVSEMSELLCLLNRGQDALVLLADAPAENRREQAHLEMMRGWAYRQLDQLENAEKSLETALEISPQVPRCHFQLGRVYEAQGKQDLALGAYRRALILQFGDH